MNVLIDVQLACTDETTPEADTINAWVSRAVEAAGTPGSHEVSVRIVSAKEIRQLNRDYRGKDKATNVLSFPTGPIEGCAKGNSRGHTRAEHKDFGGV